MKERPILFSGSMVKAILEGRKTQTRRIIKPQPTDGYCPRGFSNNSLLAPNAYSFVNGYAHHHINCPYGIPGDRLWVRETWGAWPHMMGGCQRDTLLYRADIKDEGELSKAWQWRPSIHMPRWASRINLEITNIRAERLQEISAIDAIKEGYPKHPPAKDDEQYMPPRGWYKNLWEDINGPGSWDKNPWVWVVEFRRIDVR